MHEQGRLSEHILGLDMAFNSENLYLNRAKLVMKILGIWVPPANEGFIRKLHRIFMLSLQYLFLMFQAVYIVQVWGDLDAVSQASYLLFTQACLCFKVTVLLVNMDMLKELLRQMDSDIFQPQSETHEKILKFQATRIKKFLLAFMISSQFTCGMWALKPLFDDAGSRKFPFDMWMPVTPEKSPHYHFGYVFQLLTICMSAYMYFAVDSVALSSVIFGCAQIQIIKDKILSLVEDAYHTYLLFQLTGSVGLICMSALRILVVDWRSMQFFSILSYLSVMISQLFVCCWCGHELTATSEDLHTVLYKCIWYEQSLKFKRDLVFAMMRMRRPLVLKAGHYIPLLRQTFVSQLNTMLFLSLPKKTLSLLGIWMLPQRNILFKTYTMFMIAIQISYLVFNLIYIAVVWGDIDQMSEGSYALFTHAVLCSKTINFLFRTDTLRQLLEAMDTRVFASQSEKHHVFLEQVENMFHIAIFFQLCATILIICVLGLRITSEPANNAHFFGTLGYSAVLLTQFYLYCCQDKKFGRTLLIALECMKRPIIFKAEIAKSLNSWGFRIMGETNTSLFLGRPRKILTFFGIWLWSKKNIIFQMYMIFIMITQYSFVVFEMAYIAQVWGDIGAVSEASYLLFTQASVCYKTTAFMVNEKYLVILLDFMESEIKRLCLFFLASASTTCTLWAMIPLFDDAGTKSFPFRIWMPVTPEKSPSYELGYLYQMSAIYISAFLFIAVDSVALSMIMFGCAQLEIVMEKLEQVHRNSGGYVPRQHLLSTDGHSRHHLQYRSSDND
ncbi:Odorant receptor, partial [Operophtera brumata]